MLDRKQDRTGTRPEFEVAWYTKELGQPLQRELLRKQLDRFRRADPCGADDAAEDTPQPESPA